jgi:tripartite-type tricarboxylate transporter receptor subunit TctC
MRAPVRSRRHGRRRATALAVPSRNRSVIARDLPTVAQAGMKIE